MNVPGTLNRMLVLSVSGLLACSSNGDAASDGGGGSTSSGGSSASGTGALPGAQTEAEVCGLQACQFSAPRDPTVQPFDTCSPFNHPIGANAEYAPIEPYPLREEWKTFGGWVDNWTTFGCVSANGFAVYVSGEGDSRLGKVHKKSAPGKGEAEERFELEMPRDIVAPDDADKHIFIFEPDKDRIIETLGAWIGDGSNGETEGDVYAPWVLAGPMSDSGLWQEDHYEWDECPWCGNAHRGTRAYGGSAVAGLIRKGEFINGIHHAVAIKVPPNAINRNSPQGNSSAYVWPATASDEASSYINQGNIHMGSLLAIPSDIDLEAKFEELGIVHPYVQELARALQRYGAYIIDSGSPYKDTPEADFPGCVVYMTELANQESQEIKENQPDFWPQLGPVTGMLRVVSNNSPDSVGGGGPPAVDGACFPADLD